MGRNSLSQSHTDNLSSIAEDIFRDFHETEELFLYFGRIKGVLRRRQYINSVKSMMVLTAYGKSFIIGLWRIVNYARADAALTE